MPRNPHRDPRKSPRLKGYDYAQEGAYFVTVCTHRREHLFGAVVEGEMRCNAFGEIVWACWDDLPNHYANIELDACIVMPNHIHGIILITGDIHVHARDRVGAGLRPAPTNTVTAVSKKHGLTEVVRALKSFSARRINPLRGTPGTPVWQRSFHDHIIRSEGACTALREYIACNAAQWAADRYFV